MANDEKFEKGLAAIDTELGRNMIVAADISGSQIKETHLEMIDECFEIRRGKVDAVVNYAKNIISLVDPGPNKNVTLGLAITLQQTETHEAAEMGSFNLAQILSALFKSPALLKNSNREIIIQSQH